jgi:IclR family acetate operon transcriptional repressor
MFSAYENAFSEVENSLTGRDRKYTSGRMDQAGHNELDTLRAGSGGQLGSVNNVIRKQSGKGAIQSVQRALQILDVIGSSGGEATLTDIANKLQLKIPTCHHLLSTLISAGYAAKRRGSRAYVLGSRILALSTVCLREVNLPQRAQRTLEVLNVKTREAVQLAVLQGDEIVTVLRKEALHAVRVDLGGIGKSGAAHATATGKAILAWIPEAELLRLIETKGLSTFTPRTITDLEALREELRLVRLLGFAMDREEFQPGVLCIGAPVRTPSGTVIGSISVSCPVFRADDATTANIRELVVSAAQSLSLEEAGSPAVAAGDTSSTTCTDQRKG